MQTSPLLLALSALFITVLLTSNLIAVKLVAFGPMTLPAAVIVFPLSYLFGDLHHRRVCRRAPAPGAAAHHPLSMGLQDRLRNCRHATDLCRGAGAQAARAPGSVRHRYGLQSVSPRRMMNG